MQRPNCRPGTGSTPRWTTSTPSSFRRTLAERAGVLVLLSIFAGAAGAQWTYAYVDEQYGRHRTSFTVERTQEADPADGRFVLRPMGAGKSLPEYFPRALAGGAAPGTWPVPSGYPTYSTPYLEWTYRVVSGGWESITVPAGSFRALKVTVEGSRGKDPDPFWWPKQAMRFELTVWYAPEAGRYVQARHRAWAMTGNLFADDSAQLVEARRD